MFAWIPRKLRYLLGTLAVFSLLLPTGITHDTVITGHTVFKDAAGYDKCLAAVVGIARGMVLWFNDAVLTETDAKGQFLYAVRANAQKAPVGNDASDSPVIFGNGVVYEFVDPNGNRWVVLEGYYYTRVETNTPTGIDLPPNPGVRGETGANTSLEYVWIVEIGPTFRDRNPGPDNHEFYNFVTLINTCRFGHQTKPESNVTHAANDPYHPPGEIEHSHDVYTIDLYIGRQPTFVPAGVESSDPAAYGKVVGSVTP